MQDTCLIMFNFEQDLGPKMLNYDFEYDYRLLCGELLLMSTDDKIQNFITTKITRYTVLLYYIIL